MTTSNNLFLALRESHDLQRRLAKRLVRLQSGNPEKEQTFYELRCELKAHAAAEERFLYVPMLLKDSGMVVSRHAMSEHHELEELLEDMGLKNKSTAAWHNKCKKLSELVHHHLKEEEHGFFQQAGRTLTDRQKDALAPRYVRALNHFRKKYRDA